MSRRQAAQAPKEVEKPVPQKQPAPQKQQAPQPQVTKAPVKKLEPVPPPTKVAPPMGNLDLTKFNPDKYVKNNTPRQEVIDLKQAFDLFDEDGSGTIDPNELKVAFESMGLQTHSKLIYQVLGELDEDNSGGIDFEEFFKLATSKHAMRETRQDIKRAFNLFDYNKEGHITWDELRRVAVDLGEYEDDDQIRTTFKKGDLDEDGFVTFEDFYLIMTGSKIYYG